MCENFNNISQQLNLDQAVLYIIEIATKLSVTFSWKSERERGKIRVHYILTLIACYSENKNLLPVKINALNLTIKQQKSFILICKRTLKEEEKTFLLIANFSCWFGWLDSAVLANFWSEFHHLFLSNFFVQIDLCCSFLVYCIKIRNIGWV